MSGCLGEHEAILWKALCGYLVLVAVLIVVNVPPPGGDLGALLHLCVASVVFGYFATRLNMSACSLVGPAILSMGGLLCALGCVYTAPKSMHALVAIMLIAGMLHTFHKVE